MVISSKKLISNKKLLVEYSKKVLRNSPMTSDQIIDEIYDSGLFSSSYEPNPRSFSAILRRDGRFVSVGKKNGNVVWRLK